MLSRVKKGDVIYEVYAQTAPIFPGDDPEDDKLEKIANLRLKSDLLQSKWADEELFFRHRPVHKDRRFWPREWRRLNEDVRFDKKVQENVFGNETPEWPECTEHAKEMFIEQSEEYGCPFAWLMPANWSYP